MAGPTQRLAEDQSSNSPRIWHLPKPFQSPLKKWISILQILQIWAAHQTQLQTSSPRRPYLLVLLQGALLVWALFDTGCDVSCLSEETFHKLPKAGELSQNKLSYCGANGLDLQELSSLPIQVCISRWVVTHVLHHL